MVLFVDNLLTFGSSYVIENPNLQFDHRQKRLEGLKEVNVISKILTQAKNEINLIQCKNDEEPLK